ncbi:MAG TPA: CNNM domain-containing protein [Chlamydiales bacterium]|nr:CNNM domain-containing protein [Chlamydiales bacterium]
MIYLFLTLLSVFIQGLFALFEMASLSASRIRLQYYASIGNRRAIWLCSLLQHPSRFFGTTLIGVNTALLIGSECSRKFYEYLNLNPDIAPITQVFLVVIVGELSPMFAARRHPSQLSLALVPYISVISRIFLPLIWLFGLISKMIGKSKDTTAAFSRDEVAIAFLQREDSEDELNVLTEKIFQFKNRSAAEMMTPLEQAITVPTTANLQDVTQHLKNHYDPMIFFYRHQKNQIVAFAFVRDLLRLENLDPIFEKSKAPWFVSKETSILEVLHQFRTNKQSAAVILDLSGKACGILTLDQIISQIFGKEATIPITEESPLFYIERTLPGEMTIHAFNQEFHAKIPSDEDETIGDLMIRELGHAPVSGEIVRVDSFEFVVKDATMLGVGTVLVSSLND